MIKNQMRATVQELVLRLKTFFLGNLDTSFPTRNQKMEAPIYNHDNLCHRFCCLATKRQSRSYRQSDPFSKQYFEQPGTAWWKRLEDTCSRRSGKEFMNILNHIDKKKKQLAFFQTWKIYNDSNFGTFGSLQCWLISFGNGI